MPECSLARDSLVAEDALEKGLISLRHPACLLDERREANGLLVVDQVRKPDHHGRRLPPSLFNPSRGRDFPTQAVASPVIIQFTTSVAIVSGPLSLSGGQCSAARRWLEPFAIKAVRLSMYDGRDVQLAMQPTTDHRQRTTDKNHDDDRTGLVPAAATLGVLPVAAFDSVTRSPDGGTRSWSARAITDLTCARLSCAGGQAGACARGPAAGGRCVHARTKFGRAIVFRPALSGRALHPRVIDELGMVDYGFRLAARDTRASSFRLMTARASSSGMTTTFARRKFDAWPRAT